MSSRSPIRRLLWAVLACAGLTAQGAFAAGPFDAIYAFGDSLTDTGNEPAEPYLHYEGRWSNGPLWVEHLSKRFGLAYNPSNNHAHSGAQCDDTYRQVREFFPSNDVSASLFIVWAGGNDFLQEYDEYWFDDDGWDQFTAYSVGNLSNAVLTLRDKGARFILVPNTVDVTEIPTLNYLPDFLRDYLRSKVRLFNNRLSVALDALQAGNPELRIYRCDIFARVRAMLKEADDYGFTEKNIDALADVTLLDKSFDGPGARYVFWDPIHPTTKAHAIVADWFHAAVAPLAPELGIGSEGGIALTARQLHVSRDYTLEHSPDAVVWSNAQTFRAFRDTQTFPMTNSAPQGFFRVRWRP